MFCLRRVRPYDNGDAISHFEHTGNARVRDAQGAQQSGYCRTERERSLEQPGPKGNAQISPKQQIRTGRILFPVLASKR